MNQPQLDLPATPERLRVLADSGVLPGDTHDLALVISVESPSALFWRRFLSIGLLGLGSLLVLSGVVYFFAFNWAELHRFGKLGLIAAAITASAIAAWRLGETLAGQFALLFAAVLVGPLLAVYGQAYQTGADPFELFLGWSALIVPWVALARFGPLWLLLLVLADVGIGLYWEQALPWEGHGAQAALGLTLALLNGAAWAAHEYFAFREVRWLQSRWLPRVLALMTVAPALAVAAWLTVAPDDGTFAHVACLLLVGAIVALTWTFHRRVRSELFFLTLDAFAVMVLVTIFLGISLFRGSDDTNDWIGATLMMGLLILGQLAAAVFWLRSESQVRGGEEA